ncbi:unnamed protein product [Cyclocybe aegerita]|uniref:Zn(2)-C6 fungal-type domain-containing protein n=1 Tax=Cyclocybe aegerita TaxID=1973307 RepID=A0A8S0VV36_CYCAE|nr:unnamed protein product [Cyclocybe aegerita]
MFPNRPFHYAPPDDPPSSFAQTLREFEEKFFDTFPAAREAAEREREQALTATYFSSVSFSYDSRPQQEGYSTHFGAQPLYDQAYNVVEELQPVGLPPSTSHLVSQLHYDYRPQFEYPQQYIPDQQQSQLPEVYAPVQYAPPTQQIVHYAPSEGPIPPTPALQVAIPRVAPPAHYPEPPANPSYPHPPPHRHGIIHSSVYQSTPVQSPVDSLSQVLYAYPPGTPSEVASSPTSDLALYSPAPVIVPSQDPRQATHHLHQPQMESSSRINEHLESLTLPSTSASLTHANQHAYDHHRQTRSLSQVPPPHIDRATVRGGSWGPAGSPTKQSRGSMRLSPLPSKRHLEKKPPLACLFCRGRKIACGPPLPGSVDKTCNQCQRRSLRCEYPSESRRGMRKKKNTDSTDTVDQDPTPSSSSAEPQTLPTNPPPTF